MFKSYSSVSMPWVITPVAGVRRPNAVAGLRDIHEPSFTNLHLFWLVLMKPAYCVAAGIVLPCYCAAWATRQFQGANITSLVAATMPKIMLVYDMFAKSRSHRNENPVRCICNTKDSEM